VGALYRHGFPLPASFPTKEGGSVSTEYFYLPHLGPSMRCRIIPMHPTPVNLTPPDAFAMIAARAAWHQDTPPSAQVAYHVAGEKERFYAFSTRGWHRWH
jgi:hypothetical protein